MAEVTEHHHDGDELCTESKLLALHISTVALARALALSGALNREIFNQQLEMAAQWMERVDNGCGHNVQAFDELRKMLEGV